MSGEEWQASGYRCCPHCAEDIVHDVPRDGHEVPCTSCLAVRPSTDTETLRKLADELEADSQDAMARADQARSRDDRTMHAVNVRHARVAAHAAIGIRAALEGPS